MIELCEAVTYRKSKTKPAEKCAHYVSDTVPGLCTQCDQARVPTLMKPLL